VRLAEKGITDGSLFIHELSGVATTPG
jgi:hypothetical protein